MDLHELRTIPGATREEVERVSEGILALGKIEPKRPMDCFHETFESSVSVYRLSDAENGPITGYAAEVHIRCAACLLPFQFVGLPGGLHPDKPTTSFDMQEARLPIVPSEAKQKGGQH